MSSPDRQAILNEHFKSAGLSRKNAAKAARSYDRKRRVITECAKIRGSRPFYVGNKMMFNATRGSRAQVMHGTAHHTCGGMLKKGDLTRHPKTGKIVSLARRRAGLKRWKMMSASAKAAFKANMGRGFGKKSTHSYNLRPNSRKARGFFKGLE